MIPAAFDYTRAASVGEAIGLLQEHSWDAKLLAGGHSLIPLMKLRLASPPLIVDIGRLDELRYVRADGDVIAIGSLTRYADLMRDPVIAARCPLIAEVTATVGDPQVRHRGTLGGSVAHGDSAADFPATLLALDAKFVIDSGSERRIVAAEDMFTGFFSTALEPSELLVEIRVRALRPGQGWSYQKFTRRAQDWAIVGVAAVVDHADGEVRSARVGLTNMGSVPIRATAVEASLRGTPYAAIEAAASAADVDTSPSADVNADEDFRRHLARVLTRRALETAVTGS